MYIYIYRYAWRNAKRIPRRLFFRRGVDEKKNKTKNILSRVVIPRLPGEPRLFFFVVLKLIPLKRLPPKTPPRDLTTRVTRPVIYIHAVFSFISTSDNVFETCARTGSDLHHRRKKQSRTTIPWRAPRPRAWREPVTVIMRSACLQYLTRTIVTRFSYKTNCEPRVYGMKIIQKNEKSSNTFKYIVTIVNFNNLIFFTLKFLM